MKGIIGLILLLIAPLPPVAGPSVQPTEMITIAPGEFVMGSSDKDIEWAAKTFFSESLDYYRDETPASHSGYYQAYKIDITEVTMGQYRSYIEANWKARPKVYGQQAVQSRHPAGGGGHLAGGGGLLRNDGETAPTEAEWEKAARGVDRRYYPWGNEPDETKANVRGKKDGYRYSAPVGRDQYGVSPYGLRDMAGNAWEWTADWYQPHPGNTHPNDFYGEQFRVIKGGSWFSNMDLARIAVRGKSLPDRRNNYIGFRCAK